MGILLLLVTSGDGIVDVCYFAVPAVSIIIPFQSLVPGALRQPMAMFWPTEVKFSVKGLKFIGHSLSNYCVARSISLA